MNRRRVLEPAVSRLRNPPEDGGVRSVLSLVGQRGMVPAVLTTIPIRAETKGRERNRLALNRTACNIYEIELAPRSDLKNVDNLLRWRVTRGARRTSRKSSFTTYIRLTAISNVFL